MQTETENPDPSFATATPEATVSRFGSVDDVFDAAMDTPLRLPMGDGDDLVLMSDALYSRVVAIYASILSDINTPVSLPKPPETTPHTRENGQVVHGMTGASFDRMMRDFEAMKG